MQPAQPAKHRQQHRQLTIALDFATYEALTARAEQQGGGRSKGSIVREALSAYLTPARSRSDY